MLVPSVARAQPGEPSNGGYDATGYAPPFFGGVPAPIGSTRPEEGGFFVNTSFSLFQISNPIANQIVAHRGFRVFDDSLGPVAGTIIGTNTPALNTQQLRDDRNWQPGWTFNIGWKFRDGSAIELNWFYLTGTEYRAAATPFPQHQPFNATSADSFLFTNTYNLPIEFSGPPNKILGGSTFVAFGLFNGASIMTESWRQRFQQWELAYRWVVLDEEDRRLYGIIGPRFAWFWEKYKLTSTNYAADGTGGSPDDVGIFTAITSNRMYGVHAGAQCDQYLGHGFACVTEGQASLFLDSVKERGQYETGNKYGGNPVNKFARREFSVVPELEGSVGLMWFPTEAVEFSLKYQGMVYFNTLATQRPMADDYAHPRPDWQSTIRWMHGLQAAVGIHF
jgi:hypothetical protein